MNGAKTLWSPTPVAAEATELAQFQRWLEQRTGTDFAGYHRLHSWSVEQPDMFWRAVWEYFGIDHDGAIESVRSPAEMPGCRWFQGTRLNYAEHMLRYGRDDPDAIAVIHASELRPMSEVNWRDLTAEVRILATFLRDRGVKRGDRVVAYMSNIVETLVAMLATTAIGAVWAAAAPEFGVQTVLDRFRQIDPAVLIAVDGYHFGGRHFDRTDEVRSIVAGLPGLKLAITLGYTGTSTLIDGFDPTVTWNDAVAGQDPGDAFRFERVGSDHPLWILFSSGTTGMPKAIVHSHVGIVLELLKYNAFHADQHAGDRSFFYATTGWMVWNSLVSGLLLGAIPILYDGHPTSPPDLLWRLCAEARATSFGASPTFVQQMQRADIVPGEAFDLSALRTVVLSGSPATPEIFEWFYRAVKRDVWVSSQSGGTEFCSALVGGVPTLPVRAGMIQGKCLGIAVESWDDSGQPVIDVPAELVVTAPTPSMPLYLWNDPDGHRYHDAFFDTYPSIWRHGDFITFDREGASVISGRSDATLNRFGVRIGAAEIYNALTELRGVVDSLVLCIETTDAGYWMPLFVRLPAGDTLSDQLVGDIKMRLRERASPRHVPDEVIQVPDLPYTLTGKKLEIPLRRLLTGEPAERVMGRDTMMNPAIVDWYNHFARTHPMASAIRRQRAASSDSFEKKEVQ